MSDVSIFRMVAPICIVTAIRQLDEKDPTVALGMRVASLIIFSILLIIWALIRSRINSANDQTKINVKSKDMEPPNPLESLTGAPQDEPGSEMSVFAFDTQHLYSNLKRLAIQSIIVAVMHFKWAFMVPIIISPLMALLNLTSEPLFRIHVLGKSEADDPKLKRPWQAEKSALAKMLQGDEEPKAKKAPSKRRKAE